MKTGTGKILVLVLILLLSGGFFVWSSGQKEKTAVEPAESKAKVIFFYRIGAANYEWITEQIEPRFEAAFPYIDLEIVHLSGSRAEADQKILVAVASNQHVDVVRTNPEINITQYAEQGIVIPIDQFAAASGFDKENFYQAGIDMVTVDGKMYGVPNTILPRPVIWYVEDYFKEAGVPLPHFDWTTSDWRSAAIKLRQDKDGDGTVDIFGTGYPTSDVENEIFLNGFGGGFLDQTGTKSLANLPESLEGAQFIYDMIYKDNSAPKPDQLEGNMNQMFGAGRLAMTVANYWNRNLFREQMGDKYTWRPNMIPKGTKGRYMQFVAGCWSILRTSRHPQEAFEWLKFYSSEEINTEFVRMGFNPACRPAVNNRAEFKNDRILQEFLPLYEVQQYGVPVWPKNLRRPQYVQIVRNALQRMYSLGEEPSVVMPELHTEITELLQQPKL